MVISTVLFVQIVGQGIANNSDDYDKNNDPSHGVYECHGCHSFVCVIRGVMSGLNPTDTKYLVSL